jgi:hypothetical protein
VTSALEGVGSQHHAPAALPPGKPRYPLYRRLGGPQGRSGRVQKIAPPPGFDPRTVQPVVSRYTDWAIRPTYLMEWTPYISLKMYRLSPSYGCITEATGFPEAWFNFYQIKQESQLIKWNGPVVHERTHFFFWYNFGPIREEKRESDECFIPVRPSVRKKATLTGSTFLEFFICNFFLLKSTHIFRFGVRSDTNNPLFRWRHVYICMIGFRMNWRFKYFSFYRRSRITSIKDQAKRGFIHVLLDNQIFVSQNIATHNTTVCTGVF